MCKYTFTRKSLIFRYHPQMLRKLKSCLIFARRIKVIFFADGLMFSVCNNNFHKYKGSIFFTTEKVILARVYLVIYVGIMFLFKEH